MPLADLLNCKGVQTTEWAANLLRVVLFNILRALERGHVTETSARDVLQELLDFAENDGRAIDLITVTELHAELVGILSDARPHLFFERAEPITSHTESVAVTYQPSWTFAHWLRDEVLAARNPDHTPADVLTLIQNFKSPGNWRPGATVAPDNDVLWLTPSRDAVGRAVEQAAAAQLETDLLQTMGHADRLRRLLGLHKRGFPEQAVAVVLKRKIGERLAEAEEAVRSGGAKRRALAAPTQFDAQGYPRFRHWPASAAAEPDDYGRTWPLDGAGAGAPEVVSRPQPLSAVDRLTYLGAITDAQEGDTETVAFAQTVCGSVTTGDLLKALGERLGL